MEIRNPQSAIRNRRGLRGMTLIELLITMVIIAIISAAILGTASAAFENARRSRTQSLITKISGLVLERWDSYANRRVDIAKPIEDAIELKYRTQAITAAERGQMLADARLLALRELMKMEMPDRWSDIVNKTVPASPPYSPALLANIPALARTYFRRMQDVSGHADFIVNQQAECLYLTVMYATGDGEARTLFSSQDIGDTDGDGAPEFVDGWGEPIRWLRWAPGFVGVSPLLTGDAEKDHDPFDMFRRDSTLITPTTEPQPSEYPPALGNVVQLMRQRNMKALSQSDPRLTAFRIIPLIYSIGPDKESGIVIGQEGQLNQPVGLDPYILTSEGDQLGSVLSDTDEWRDTIHNHVNQY